MHQAHRTKNNSVHVYKLRVYINVALVLVQVAILVACFSNDYATHSVAHTYMHREYFAMNS